MFGEQRTIQTSLPPVVLETVRRFFETGYWPNPYLAENRDRFSVPGVCADLTTLCAYLGLPGDNIEQVDDREDDGESYDCEYDYEYRQDADYDDYDPDEDEYDPEDGPYLGRRARRRLVQAGYAYRGPGAESGSSQLDDDW
ncbi:hypothetical protein YASMINEVIRUS_1179 [Yasminevirus sp. GU-2018]|uniref:Uncharacterized protein n=1 Tax=Yasminevirus sp. GU-2018 TaxID=2420051 RepID=A0A5K0U9H2_9VIRU|nr:hypothetical protein YASMINEVIRUS_1179 [Yasminevirus sp. GU-2018]